MDNDRGANALKIIYDIPQETYYFQTSALVVNNEINNGPMIKEKEGRLQKTCDTLNKSNQNAKIGQTTWILANKDFNIRNTCLKRSQCVKKIT